MSQCTDDDGRVQYRSLGDWARNDPSGYAEAFGGAEDDGYPESEPYTDLEIAEAVEQAYFGRALPDDERPPPF